MVINRKHYFWTYVIFEIKCICSIPGPVLDLVLGLKDRYNLMVSLVWGCKETAKREYGQQKVLFSKDFPLPLEVCQGWLRCV